MLEGIEIGDLNGKGMLSAAASDVEAPTPKSGSALHTLSPCDYSLLTDIVLATEI